MVPTSAKNLPSPLARGSLRAAEKAAPKALLSPMHAWRVVRRRSGGAVSRTTFYRWLDCGKVFSLRVGHRLYIPWPALEEIIQGGQPGKACRAP